LPTQPEKLPSQPLLPAKPKPVLLVSSMPLTLKLVKKEKLPPYPLLPIRHIKPVLWLKVLPKLL
jgi:hypothetical protein